MATVKARHITKDSAAGSSASPVMGTVRTPPRTPARAAPSESWDDDFLFQETSTAASIAPPLSTPPKSTSRSSRHTDHKASNKTPQPTPSSTPQRATTSSKMLSIRPAQSTESIASDWSDPEPTLVLAPHDSSTHTTPRQRGRARAPLPPPETFPTISSATTTSSDSSVQASPSMSAGSSPDPDGFRSQTPSLSEASSSHASFTSSNLTTTTGEGVDRWTTGKGSVREREDRERDRFGSGGRSTWSRDEKVLLGGGITPGSASKKKWKLTSLFGGGSASGGGLTNTGVAGPPRDGSGGERRSREREILQTGTNSVGGGQLVVLGRRSRGNSNAIPPSPSSSAFPSTPASPTVTLSSTVAPLQQQQQRQQQPSYLSSFPQSYQRTPNSSLDTNSSGYSKRSSLQPAQTTYPAPILTRSYSISGGRPPLLGSRTSLDRWREYDEATTSSETEGDNSELSEGERDRARAASPSSARAVANSGVGIGMNGPWSTSQVSFASSVGSGRDRDGNAEVRRKNQGGSGKRLKKKKRPEWEGTEENKELERMQKPLLKTGTTSATSFGGRSSISATKIGEEGTDSPALAFAQDSGEEGVTTTVDRAQRRVSKGEVEEIDNDWLGVVPFPPSPTLHKKSSKLVRKDSKGKSYPPVSGKSREVSGESSTSLASKASRSRKRAPSPAPSPVPPSPTIQRRPSTPSKLFGILRSASSSSIRQQQSSPQQPAAISTSKDKDGKVHRHSASVTEIPKIKTESSFLARARAFSRPNSNKPPLSLTSAVTTTSSTSPSRVRASASATSLVRAKEPSPTASLPGLKPRLGENWKMPRPNSTVSNVSTSTTSTVRSPGAGSQDPAAISSMAPPPLPKSSTMSELLRKTSGKRPSRPPISGRHPRFPSNTSSNSSSSSSATGNQSTVRRAVNHRPSLSLSSAIDKPERSPLFSKFSKPQPSPQPERPRTAMAVDRPASYFFDGDSIASGSGPVLGRRNSLSDLKIPSRITSAQARIEEDLQRVKEFAKGIDGLKSLRRQYQQLITIVVSPPSSPDPDMSSSPHSLSGPSPEAIQKMAQAVKRLEMDYRSWWEQAEALVDLGDGKRRDSSSLRESPGVASSKRERCVSLATTSPGKAPRSGSETEMDQPQPDKLKRPEISRRPSASSVETGFSVGERQKEMLRGVLAPMQKGASLPSRGPPSPRPSLGVLDTNLRSHSTPGKLSPTTMKKPTPDLSPSINGPSNRRAGIRRVSKAGVSGIKDFLLRLKVKAAEADLVDDMAITRTMSGRSVSSPARSGTPSKPPFTPKHQYSSDSSEAEDWDKEESPHQKGLSIRRSRTQSTKVPSGRDEKMVLTTEAMPGLLLKVKEVHARCEECLVRLRGVTV